MALLSVRSLSTQKNPSDWHVLICVLSPVSLSAFIVWQLLSIFTTALWDRREIWSQSVTHYNFFHLKKWEKYFWLAFLCRKFLYFHLEVTEGYWEMSVYRQIGGGESTKKCVHHYFISFFEKDACSCVQAWKVATGLTARWLASKWFLFSSLCLPVFFLQDKVYNGKGKALSLFCGFSESKTDVWISREKEVFTNRTVGW